MEAVQGKGSVALQATLNKKEVAQNAEVAKKVIESAVATVDQVKSGKSTPLAVA